MAIRAQFTVLGVLMSLLVAPVADLHAAAESATAAAIHSLTPAPEQVVAAGAISIEAWLAGDTRIVSSTLEIDGRPVVDAELGDRDASMGVPLRADVHLADGLHTLTVRFEAEDGASATRTWTVAAADVTFVRRAGVDRYATAVAISRAHYPAAASAAAAVLARGDAFADGLAGAPLARAVDGPLLLSASTSLHATTADELVRVLESGATVHLLGGTEALSDQVAHDVEALGFTTRRHTGRNRYATAASIASALPSSTHAFVLSGTAFPDALAASVPAARDGSPILLTARDDLPVETTEALASGAIERVTIVGGTAAVSEDVEADLARVVDDVERLDGADRYATAVAVADAHFVADAQVALAAGDGFADALAGAAYLASLGRPLLLVARDTVPAPTADALRRRQPSSALVLGGTAAITEQATDAVRAALLDDPDAPDVVDATPAPGSAVRWLEAVTFRADVPLAADTRAYLSIAGREVEAAIERPDARTFVLAFDALAVVPYDRWRTVNVFIALVDTDGRTARRAWSFDVHVADPHVGDAGPVPVFLPSRDVQVIGFHQSNHDGAQQIDPRGTSTSWMTMESRGRGTGSRSAADIVANPDLPVFAPATGTVRRAGSYTLYCDHTDHYLVIEPDAAPGWEVKMLHFEGLSVRAGDRVTGGRTQVGTRPRVLPFASQVDESSDARNWPHVHVEVVDPSIPDRPGTGC